MTADHVSGQLLERLEHEAEGLTFAELVEEIDQPASTIHKLVRILDKQGKIYPDRCYDLDGLKELETVTWRATGGRAR